ncbi:hypothetical protein LTR22_017346 [Elasticomyces elasticus]|nr:hypothetical protein LTR22_017346 [Elasticomyces elasticus]KAK4913451.1 hypothetical protein LTR49_018247 [Elasticomyces elasticus]KAK5760979.1 hypothetical protein LTS12_008827 [Elasticomyces elasticus]
MDHVPDARPAWTSRSRNPRKFFMVGKVFRGVWSEPTEAASIAVKAPGFGVSEVVASPCGGQLSEPVWSRLRRLVVISESDSHAFAEYAVLPIKTYHPQGVSKQGVCKSDHHIIYAGRKIPQPFKDSYGTILAQANSGPICVEPGATTESLDPMSRLDYANIYTICHNGQLRIPDDDNIIPWHMAPADACPTLKTAKHTVVQGCLILAITASNIGILGYAIGHSLIRTQAPYEQSCGWASTAEIERCINRLGTPSPLTFVGCAVAAALMMRLYAYSNRSDKLQTFCIFIGMLCWPIISVAMQLGLLAGSISVMPWTVFGSLLVSHGLHVAMRKMSPAQIVLMDCGCDHGHQSYIPEAKGSEVPQGTSQSNELEL